MLWESGMAFPLIAAMVVFVVVMLGVIKVFELRMGSWKVQQSVWPIWVAAGVASASAAWGFVKLFI